MANKILYNGSLKAFIESLKISRKGKDALIAKVDTMDFAERAALFKKLLMVYFLDLESEEAIKKIGKYCKE
ncbi:MAG: hypothetical protein PHG23_00415 [Candidatus Pacebacteria bacterium]|nr:hypothetical protein [Candidatus Paceibacterota bacterium]